MSRRRVGARVSLLRLYTSPPSCYLVCKRMSLHEACAVCLGRPPVSGGPLVELMEVRRGGGESPPAGGARKDGRVSL